MPDALRPDAPPSAGWWTAVTAVPPTGSNVDAEGDERELIDRAKAGDQIALGRLFDEHYPRVYRYLRLRVGQTEDAEDLAQETFLRMCTALDRYQHRGIPFRSWLMQIASNLGSDFWRRRRGAPTWSLYDAELETLGEEDPVEVVELQLTLEEVTRAMEQLTELEREVIRLRYAAELSIAETAAAIGRTENNVKQLAFKALGKLRRIMGQRNAGAG